MWEPYERIHEGACALETLVFLGGQRRFPWALTLTLGWGKVEVSPPDSLSTLGWSRGYSLGNSKKGKKNKHFFLAQVSTQVYYT